MNSQLIMQHQYKAHTTTVSHVYNGEESDRRAHQLITQDFTQAVK